MGLPAFPMESVRVRNVMDTIRLNVQLVEVEREVPKLRAHSGYISELIVHGIGPIPTTVEHVTYGEASDINMTGVLYFVNKNIPGAKQTR